MIDGPGAPLLLDIRGESDLAAGMIQGSIHIPLVKLDTRVEEIPREKKIVLVDLHGKQVRTAGRFLAYRGFKDVSRLDGGLISGWMKAGLPVVK